MMIIFLITLIYFLPIRISNIDIPFLSVIIANEFFQQYLFYFVFVINGANLIDGFNGLLTINLIIINFILIYLNISSSNVEFSMILISQVIILLSFLLFNFPNAKIFLGDSGAYLMGSLVSLNTIITNNLNPNISSFFFCTILFYLFLRFYFLFFENYARKNHQFILTINIYIC